MVPFDDFIVNVGDIHHKENIIAEIILREWKC